MSSPAVAPRLSISPEPSDEEAAAIAAAITVEMTSASDGSTSRPDEPSRWRFSGRWWSKPTPARRDRP